MEHEKNPDTITLYGADWCPDCRRAKQFFGEHRIQYVNIDIEQHPETESVIKALNDGMRIIPTIIFPDGEVLAEPSNAELAAKLGISTQAECDYYEAIIIGAGPTGLTAATYLGREGASVLVIDKAGVGGQTGITQVLDNFPGFDEGIPGAELAERLARQSERFGAEIVRAQEVSAIEPDGIYWRVTTSDGVSYSTKALLLATGARYRRLDVPGEDSLIGINIHFCATCDGAFYKGKNVLVVGGGNSGFEEGLFLTRFADRVDIVERSATPKASAILQDKVRQQPKMQVSTNRAVKAFTLEDGNLGQVLLEDAETGAVEGRDYDGVFVFIGLEPNSALAAPHADTERGFVATDGSLMTRTPGLFAAGDVRFGSTKQAASAAGEGATAALMIRQYLQQLG